MIRTIAATVAVLVITGLGGYWQVAASQAKSQTEN